MEEIILISRLNSHVSNTKDFHPEDSWFLQPHDPYWYKNLNNNNISNTLNQAKTNLNYIAYNVLCVIILCSYNQIINLVVENIFNKILAINLYKYIRF